VQEALEIMGSLPSIILSLTPKTTVLISSSKGGTLKITLFAPLLI